jgi:hypothetical protein
MVGVEAVVAGTEAGVMEKAAVGGIMEEEGTVISLYHKN